jgi:CubicO group peptidase (beta-lactamase class C family)
MKMTGTVHRILLVSALLLSFAAALAGPLAADETTDKVDKLFASWDKTTSPGATLAVIRDGRIIYKRGYGMAKLEDGIVMAPDKIFDIGSVSKQFTATCVVMLVRQGKVALDDNVRKYIPELPDYGTPITVRHLLHHTSGLRDYNALLELAGFRGDSDCPNVDEALDVICRQKKLNYPPGTEYSYTNTGFFLLSQIVERASGKSLNAFAQEHVFKPLGMEHTLYQDDHTQIIKNRASGYDQDGRGFKLNMSNWDETGDGNVYTSVEDLYLWDQAFYTNALGKDVMDMLQTTGTLNNGQKIAYAFGLRVGEYRGLKTVRHSGSWAGFRAALVRFPEQNFSVICLANLSSISPSQLCNSSADIYLDGLLKDPLKEEKAKPAGNASSMKEFESRAGRYQETKFGHWVEIARTDLGLKVTLMGDAFSLKADGPGDFRSMNGVNNVRLEFLPDENGRPMAARLTFVKAEEYLLKKADAPAALEAGRLLEYAGSYISPELFDACYQIAVNNGGLILKTRTVQKGLLRPMAPDKFTSPDLEVNIDFVRDKTGKISGFKLGYDGAGGIEFVKK